MNMIQIIMPRSENNVGIDCNLVAPVQYTWRLLETEDQRDQFDAICSDWQKRGYNKDTFSVAFFDSTLSNKFGRI